MQEHGLFDLLATPAPSLSAHDAEEFAAREFGIEGSATSLASERDQNFHLTCADGRSFVLKIANSAEDPAVTHLQTAALLHVAANVPELPVPRVVKTLRGDTEVVVDAGDPCTVRMLTYLPGTPWRSATTTPALPRSLGRSLAHLDRALRGFSHPAARRELLWDITHVARLRELFTYIDPSHRPIAHESLDHLERHVASRLPALRAQVIHNDFNPSNVLVDATLPDRIIGIIDFGDLVHAPLVNDVAVGAAYHPGRDGDPLELAEEFVGAYHSVNPLEPDEIEVLFDLILARLLTTVTITEWRATRYPDNRAYILRNNPAAWIMLKRLRDVSRAEAIARFRGACPSRPSATSTPVHTRMSTEELLARRARLLGPAYRLFYDSPLHLVRGEGIWLYDTDGRAYLDVYNNVAHVGHCHPRVVEALAREASILNTHTRYLHTSVLDYAERLTATLPDSLSTAMFACTGSEANELALRIARAATGGRGIIATEFAYHGNTAAIAQLSTAYYPSAEGAGPHARTVPAPDLFRRRARFDDDDPGEGYARCVLEAIESLQRAGIPLAAFIVDTLFTSDGIIPPPPGYLARAIEYVHAAGGVFIADEVQAGLGRTGQHFWGFESQGVVPDIVTMGKPLGNGHPVAAVVARPDLVERFAKTTRYFNTFGGNPVSAAVGLAVLDVMNEEQLQANALNVGAYLQRGLRELAARHPIVGDVRGAGLFIGVELVRDRETLEPATKETARVVNALKENRVLTSTAGPHGSILKLRPPLVFSRANADFLIETLDRVLVEAAFADGSG